MSKPINTQNPELEYTTPSGHVLQVSDHVQHLQTFDFYEVVELTEMVATIANKQRKGETLQVTSPAVICRSLGNDDGELTRLWVKKVDIEQVVDGSDTDVWTAFKETL